MTLGAWKKEEGVAVTEREMCLTVVQTAIWSGKRGAETARGNIRVTLAYPSAPEIESGAG